MTDSVVAFLFSILSYPKTTKMLDSNICKNLTNTQITNVSLTYFNLNSFSFYI